MVVERTGPVVWAADGRGCIAMAAIITSNQRGTRRVMGGAQCASSLPPSDQRLSPKNDQRFRTTRAVTAQSVRARCATSAAARIDERGRRHLLDRARPAADHRQPQFGVDDVEDAFDALLAE